MTATGDRPDAPVRDGPDAEGFHGWTFGGDGFNASLGRMMTRGEGEAVRVRVATGRTRGNVHGFVHGGFLLAVLDQALFVGPIAIGRLKFASAVTLNLATQFVGAARTDAPLDCIVEIVGETGRMLFLRGTIEQGDRLVLSYQATLRKHGGGPA